MFFQDRGLGMMLPGIKPKMTLGAKKPLNPVVKFKATQRDQFQTYQYKTRFKITRHYGNLATN